MPSPTRYVVGATIGLALLAAAYAALGLHWGLVALAFGLYEGWTLVNRWPNDTISEIVWELAERPMVPFVFGTGTGWALAQGWFSNAFVAIAWGFLMGHFFFQRFERR